MGVGKASERMDLSAQCTSQKKLVGFSKARSNDLYSSCGRVQRSSCTPTDDDHDKQGNSQLGTHQHSGKMRLQSRKQSVDPGPPKLNFGSHLRRRYCRGVQKDRRLAAARPQHTSCTLHTRYHHTTR